MVRGMEGKRQANKGQERSGELEEMKVMKGERCGKEHSLSHSDF